MAEILSVLAFIMAFGAIWLASETVRRFDHQNQEFHRQYIKGLKDTINEAKTAVGELRKRVSAMDRELEDFKDQRGKDAKILLALEHRTRELKPEPKPAPVPAAAAGTRGAA